MSDAIAAKVRQGLKDGTGKKALAKALGIGVGTVQRIARDMAA